MINPVPTPSKHRKSIRLPEYDYRQDGVYYVTLVIHNRVSLLGKIEDEAMILSAFGQATFDAWQWLAQQYSYVECGPFVIMPNHLHGILIFHEPDRCSEGAMTQTLANHDSAYSFVGAVREPPLQEEGEPTDLPKRKPLGRIIGAFKTVSSKRINALRNTQGQIVWQRNYYEHIVRCQPEMEQIAFYIESNPLQWALDQENPASKVA